RDPSLGREHPLRLPVPRPTSLRPRRRRAHRAVRSGALDRVAAPAPARTDDPGSPGSPEPLAWLRLAGRSTRAQSCALRLLRNGSPPPQPLARPPFVVGANPPPSCRPFGQAVESCRRDYTSHFPTSYIESGPNPIPQEALMATAVAETLPDSLRSGR